MINGTRRNEHDPAAEPSDYFLSLVLELDADLHNGRLPEFAETTLQELCPAERKQLERIRRQLEQRYADTPAAKRQPRNLDATRIDTGEAPGFDQPDFNISPDLQASPGIHGTQFGRFEVLRGLGMGGHGIVFLARDPVLDRLIALKVPRPDVLVLSSMRKRFLAEGRAAALLAHPNIVTVFESGEVGSICYLAQDYIAGPSLAAWLRDHPQPFAPRLAAEMILPLAEAVALAHSRQILHRDIKPGNILLAPRTTAESIDDIRAFEPMLADFGMAKLMQAQAQTRTGAILGTPAYMSPEQAAGRKESMGAASDIYSLGAVLYELLTHKPLFQAASDLETLQQVLYHNPPHPRATVPGVPRDLAAICQKCLRREPRERYHTALELADDLRRFLDGRPVVARPQSVSSKLYQWSRRNPAIAALSSLMLVAVTVLLAGSLWFSARLLSYSTRLDESLQISRQQEQDLQARTLTLRKRVYAEDLRQAAEAWQDGKATEARQRLEACLPQPGESDLRSFPWWMLSHQMQNTSQVIGTFEAGAVSASLAVHPAGEVVACGEPDGVIYLRSLPEGSLIGELRGHARGAINSMHFSPLVDEQRLVSAGDDGTVRVWDVKPQRELQVLQGHQGDVAAVRFIGQDAEAIASGGADRVIRIWDSHSGQLLSELTGHTDTIRSLVEQSDTGTLFSSSEDHSIRLWNWKSARSDQRLPEGRLPIPPRNASWVRSLALSPDGTRLAAGYRSGRLILWRVGVADDQFGGIARDQVFASGIRSLAWRDDETLVAGLADSRVLLKPDANESDGDHGFLAGHSDWILSIAVIPGKQDLVSISKDGTIRRWPGEEIDGQIRISVKSNGASSRPVWDNSILIVGTPGEVCGYAMPAGVQTFRLTIDDMLLDAWTHLTVDGARLLTTEKSSRGMSLTAFEIASGARDWQLPLGSRYPLKGCLSPDGKLVFLCMSHELWSVEAKTGQRIWRANQPREITDIQFVPQGDLVVTACQDGAIRFWNAKSGQLVQERTAHQNSAQNLALSPDGRQLATTGEDLRVRIWRIADWQEMATLGLTSELDSLHFADDGRTLIGCNKFEISFWSVPDQIEVMRWRLIRRFPVVSLSSDRKTILIRNDRHVHLLSGAP